LRLPNSNFFGCVLIDKSEKEDQKDMNSNLQKTSELSKRISNFGKENYDNHQKESDNLNSPSPIGLAFRLSTDLVAGLIVGGVMGWSIDRWLGTAPWFLIIFFILGITAGIFNVLKTAKNLNK